MRIINRKFKRCEKSKQIKESQKKIKKRRTDVPGGSKKLPRPLGDSPEVAHHWRNSPTLEAKLWWKLLGIITLHSRLALSTHVCEGVSKRWTVSNGGVQRFIYAEAE